MITEQTAAYARATAIENIDLHHWADAGRVPSQWRKRHSQSWPMLHLRPSARAHSNNAMTIVEPTSLH